jgi:hypothetical protein
MRVALGFFTVASRGISAALLCVEQEGVARLTPGQAKVAERARQVALSRLGLSPPTLQGKPCKYGLLKRG